MDDSKKICVPSFAFEKKTQALNHSLWGFVGLISMFSVTFLVMIFHEMMRYVFNITSTLISDHLTFFTLVPIIIFGVTFGVGLFSFLNSLLYSYQFENNRIIKGRIVSAAKVDIINIVSDAAITNYMIKNVGNSNKVFYANTARNMNTLIDYIKLNLTKEFVEQYFNTGIYKKKIFDNPVLTKETKYAMIYRCDGGKKLKIRKIYEGMDATYDANKHSRESSLLHRIMVRSLLVFLAFSAFSLATFITGANHNSNHLSSIADGYSYLENSLSAYGYESYPVNRKLYKFEKKVSDSRTSSLYYTFDKNGNITDVNVQLYFIPSCYSQEELRFIIDSMHAGFAEDEVDAFIANVTKSVTDEYTYGKLTSPETTLLIGRSGGHIDVHN